MCLRMVGCGFDWATERLVMRVYWQSEASPTMLIVDGSIGLGHGRERYTRAKEILDWRKTSSAKSNGQQFPFRAYLNVPSVRIAGQDWSFIVWLVDSNCIPDQGGSLPETG